MKIITKALLGIVSAIIALQATPAMAWGAVAAYDQRIVYLSVNSATPEAAKKEALEGCNNFTGKTCDWVSFSAVRTAIVVSKPMHNQGIYVSADPDPLVAAKSALRMCRIDYKECGVIGAAWDSGPTWWARAEGDNADYIHMDVDTEAEAHRLALQGCEEMVSKKGTCKVAGSGSGHGWVAVAETAELFWRGYGETKAEATKDALKKCEKEGCKITKTIENRGNVPEPASMKKVREMQSQSIAKWKKMGKWVE